MSYKHSNGMARKCEGIATKGSETICIAVAAQGNEKLGKGAERKSYGVEM